MHTYKLYSSTFRNRILAEKDDRLLRPRAITTQEGGTQNGIETTTEKSQGFSDSRIESATRYTSLRISTQKSQSSRQSCLEKSHSHRAPGNVIFLALHITSLLTHKSHTHTQGAFTPT